jgi:hypothetical protein
MLFSVVMPKGSFDLKAWARIGAERRLEEIRAEQQAIAATFPDLRVSGESPFSRARGAAGAGTRKRKRRVMSAEARRRISLAQKRRWRKQKAAKSA